MLLSRLTVWSAWSWLVVAQYQWRDFSDLCDKTIDQANASGIWTFQPDVRATDLKAVPPASWAYTVYHNASMLQTTWWYNTGGANYSDDFSIGYDVCAFRLRNVTAHARWEAYSQNDTGSCEKTLDEDCIRDLKSLANKSARDQVGDASPPANLTEGALPTVCTNIGYSLQNNLPKSCKKYFEPDMEVATWQMTDYNRTSADVGCCSELQNNSCPIYADQAQAQSTQQEILGSLDVTPNNVTMSNSDWYPSSWHAWWGLDIQVGVENTTFFNEKHYDYFTQGVFPMLTVYMSLANRRRKVYVVGNSQLTCVRAQHFTEHSRNIPPSQPSSSSTLSHAAIGGIAAGSVIGVTILLVAAFLFYRHRKAKHLAEREQSVSSGPTELGTDEKRRPEMVAELDKANEVFEKEGNSGGMEMDADAKKVFEMEGGEVDEGTFRTNRTYEMQGDGVQNELESPNGSTLIGSGFGTVSASDEKRKLEAIENADEMKRKLDGGEVQIIAELMGSEPEPKVQPAERQSWTPSVRLVENVEDAEHVENGVEAKNEENGERKKDKHSFDEEDPPRL